MLSGREGHISVDLIDGLFDRLNLARLRDGFVNLACGVMLYWPAQRVVVLAERGRSYGDVTEYLSIPTFYVEYFIAIMTFLTALVLVLRGLLHWFAPGTLEPPHD